MAQKIRKIGARSDQEAPTWPNQFAGESIFGDLGPRAATRATRKQKRERRKEAKGKGGKGKLEKRKV